MRIANPQRYSPVTSLMLPLAMFAISSNAECATPKRPESAATAKLPDFKDVKRVVVKQFSSLSDFEAQDLITRKQVVRVFAELKEIGWDVAEKKQLLAKVPADDSFLVKQMGTTQGRKFMRSVSKYPDAYDRLDRMSRLKNGQRTVKDLMSGPDGYKLIEYMTTTTGGQHLGDMLADSPGGKAFNKPTGGIYTASQLLEALHMSHQQETARRAKTAPR